MNVETFLATGSDGCKYTVRKLTTHVKTAALSGTGDQRFAEGLMRWELANGDALNSAGDRRVFTHFADPSLVITIDEIPPPIETIGVRGGFLLTR
jgi:hypothetical protein